MLAGNFAVEFLADTKPVDKPADFLAVLLVAGRYIAALRLVDEQVAEDPLAEVHRYPCHKQPAALQ